MLAKARKSMRRLSGAVRTRVGQLILCGAVLWLLLSAPAAWAVDIPVTWVGFPPGRLEIQSGDTVTFTVGGSHDLYEMPDQAALEACDFTGATLKIGSGVTDTLTFDQPGEYYYACSVGGGFHCSLDGLAMQLTVVVTEPLPSVHPSYVALALGLSGMAAAALFIERRAGFRPSRS
jgi:plastocyanin